MTASKVFSLTAAPTSAAVKLPVSIIPTSFISNEMVASKSLLFAVAVVSAAAVSGSSSPVAIMVSTISL